VCAVNLSPGAINDGGGTTSYSNFGGTLAPTTGLVQRATATIIRDQVNLTSTPTYETLFLRVAQDSGAAVNITRAQINVTRISDIPPIA